MNGGGSENGGLERRLLADLQPSQLLVSSEKLRDVLDWWDADDPDPEPLPYLHPVEDLGLAPERVEPGRVVLADGHTRALAAVLSGTETLPVVRDPDRETLSMGIYRTCLGWCVDAGVRRPADLVGRVVSDETFRTEWVQRCQAVAEE
ncbi:histone acetyltransferase [Halolamina sp. C58]|uniref:histone acetyltransferase n=1 Tax=Halolamina sp. C58 TaxID=3421640 RepID=UPI003EBEFD19